MEQQIDDGGPAFGCDRDRAHDIAMAALVGIPPDDVDARDAAYLKARAAAERGMSLRDWFAGQGEIDLEFTSKKSVVIFMDGEPWPPEDDVKAVADYAARVEAKARYIRADAMLAARKQVHDGTD